MTKERPLLSQEPPPVACPRCGFEVKRDERFCPECGMHLEGPTEPDLHPVLRAGATATNNAIEDRSTRKVRAVRRRPAKPTRKRE